MTALVAGRARSGGPPVLPRRRTTSHDVALLLSLAAGLAHLVSTRAHLDWWFESGVFFGTLAALQIGFAGLMLRGSRHVAGLCGAIWLNAGVAVVYLLSRTVGLPGQPPITGHGRFEPGRSIVPGAVEPVRLFDLLTLAAELGLIVVVVGLLPTRARHLTVNALLAAGALLWFLVLSGTIS